MNNGIGKKTVRDIDVHGRRVLVRADLNVPIENGVITDDTRIRESLPTIRYLLDQGAQVIVCSHLGRPKGPDPALSLAPVAGRMANLLGQEVLFAEDCVGPKAEAAVQAMGHHVLLLENLRFHPEEEKNDPEFARQLASLAEIFVNDAFGAAHRAHASTEGVTHYLPAVAGLLMEKEVKYLGALVANPPHPFAAVVGGAKVSSKLPAIQHLLPKVDLLLVGGGMANTFLKAKGYEIGASLVEDDLLDAARAVMRDAETRGVELHLPVDVVVASRFAADAETATVPVGEVPAGWLILDIGPETVRQFANALQRAKAVVWNGPMGVFELEPFASGSFDLARAIAGLNAVTVVGGGETAAVVAAAGLQDRFTHVSTGGGASLEMLEGKTLPGVAALLDA
ncbi:phosphoglycerate kinase [Tepidiforma thermophila]|uniref:Phosphoglycerate kinase n=1 Tax=Tepidiforma thermophila (strain KCTC 52669 / CGMCC 1.13589 / G233) TaxID=2761530 RepID=A0A2A9HIE7_TEPT2|nr:phosphoglycerate kinase [Tepidiforma thermophila]PFG74951.1 phosphoglycerate kinase [Tepidiforma thermophila]